MADQNCLLILDTMVVSALYGVGRRGFDPESATDRRVAHLLLWLKDRPTAAVFHVFGIAEGAGFHGGALEPHRMLNRAMYSAMAIEHGRIHGEDWISSGDPLPDFEVPATAVHPRNVVEPLELLLPLTVLPSYIAALAARLASERGETGVVAAESIFRRLVDSIDFVPQLALLSASLSFLGNQNLRRELRQSLFKFQQADARRACLSAGWDLGYLQLLSILRAPPISACFEGRVPVLVTEDRQLAPTAILSHCVGDSPIFEVEAAQLDGALVDEAFDFMAECGRERLFSGVLPSWSARSGAISELESELGIEGPRLGTWGKKVEVKIPPEHFREFLLLLRCPTVKSVLDSPR